MPYYVYTPIFAPFILYEQVSVKTPTHKNRDARKEEDYIFFQANCKEATWAKQTVIIQGLGPVLLRGQTNGKGSQYDAGSSGSV